MQKFIQNLYPPSKPPKNQTHKSKKIIKSTRKKQTQKFEINTATTTQNPTPTPTHIIVLCIFGQSPSRIQQLWPTKTSKPKKYLAIWSPNQRSPIRPTNQPILQSETHMNISNHQAPSLPPISPSSHHNPHQQQTHPTIHPYPPSNLPPLHNHWSKREL